MITKFFIFLFALAIILVLVWVSDTILKTRNSDDYENEDIFGYDDLEPDSPDDDEYKMFIESLERGDHLNTDIMPL